MASPPLGRDTAVTNGHDAHAFPDMFSHLDQYLTHMPQSDDLTLVVLKGHLLLEEKLERIITRYLPNPQHLDAARLSFFSRLSLARAMCWSHHSSDMWPIIEALNTLRNDLAHNLESDKLEQRIARFETLLYESVEHPELDDRFKAETQTGRVRLAVAYLLGFLNRFEIDVEAFRRQTDALRSAIATSRGGGGSIA